MFEFDFLSLLCNTTTLRNILMLLGTNVEQDEMTLRTEMTTLAGLRGNLFFSKRPLVFLAHRTIVVSQCPSCIVGCAASTIAFKVYSSYTPGPIDSILGRKHQGDL